MWRNKMNLRKIFIANDFLYGMSSEFVQGWIYGKYNWHFMTYDIQTEINYWTEVRAELEGKMI